MNQDQNDQEGIDLSHALNEAKTPINNDSSLPAAPVFDPGDSKMTRWVIKYSGRWIKDEKQASYFLMGLVTLTIIVSLILLFNGSQSPKIPLKDFENKQQVLP